MPATAELVGRVGRLNGQHPPTEHGLTLTVRVLPGSGQGTQRVAACALTADTLGLATHQGHVYAVHLSKQRYVCLDTLPAACTASAFMTRLSRRLYVGCADGGIHCYDVATSSRLAQLPGHRTAVMSLSTKSDTEQLLSASADAVLLWDMATFRQHRMLGSAPYGSSQAAFSPAGHLLAAATAAGTITLWDTRSLRELGQLQSPLGQQQQRFGVSSISISPDEQWLLAGCKAPALLLRYSLQSKALQCALRLPQEMFGVAQVLLLPDSTSAAVLSSDGCISFVDLEAGCITGRLQLTFPGCRAVSFSTDPRANTMAVVCSDGPVRLYDLGVVRAKQQDQGQFIQLQRLQPAQLQHLSTAADVLPIAAGSTAGGRHRPPLAQAAAGPSKVLADVGNVDRSAPAGRTKAKAAVKSGAAGSAPSLLGVRQLAAPAAALNRRKLQDMLLAFGEFPARYRRLIWEQLLQLPHNSVAFSLLQDKGPHPAFKDLAQQLAAPGGSRSSMAVRLQACLSQLAYWCPLFGEVGFLPDLAFPFVKLFGPKAESAFEALATLLLNWCKGWFELFPNPPLPLLRRFLLLLSQHDLELGSHLQQLGVPLLEHVWGHMSCAMSDLLPDADDWLVLWDHVLAAASGPAFYYHVLCSYLISQRHHLLAATDGKQLALVLNTRPAVDVRKVIKQAHTLLESTPEYAQLGLSTLSPLPPGNSYPVFAEYPTGSVEVQQQERQRIQEAEEALIRRRQVVAELQQRTKQVAFEATALTSQRQQLAALDAQRRAALRAIEDSLATAGARLDDRAKEEKLKQIRLAEESYEASLASLRAEWSAELAALKTDVEHKRRLAAAALKARQEEEDIKALEFQAQQRLWALQQEELAAAGSAALRDAAATQASTLAAQLQRKAAEWEVQDEARNLKQQHDLARQARLAAAAEQEAALQAAKGLLLAQELQAQEELAKVEHQRSLRQLAEDEAQLTATQLQLQTEWQAVAAAAGRQAIQEQAQAQAEKFARQQQERAAAVAAEHAAMQQQLSQLHLSAAGVGSSARLSEAQQQLAQLEANLALADQEHQQRVASILRKLQAQQQLPEVLRSSLGRSATRPAADVSPADSTTAASTASDAGGSTSAGQASIEQQDEEAAAVLDSSLEAVEQRLAAIRQRRAALESLYGAQLDAEVQRIMAGARTAQRQQQSPAGSARLSDLASPVGLLQAESPSVPTSEATAGSGSSGSSKASPAVSGSSGLTGSMDVSAELEHLLAEAEAEVQRELATARLAFAGSALYPYSSSRTPPLQQHHPSLQSSVGRGRGRSTTGSVAQGSHTVSTGVAAGGVAAAVPATTAVTGATTAGGRLKPVLEEPPPPAGRDPAAGAAAAAGGGGGGGSGPQSGPKPADSSSSSSSSPDKQGEGGKSKGAKAETSSTAAAPPEAKQAPTAGPDAQAVKPSGSSSSHGSAAGHHHHKQAQPGDVSATAAGVSAALAAAMAAAAAGSVPQLGSPGSSLSLHSSPGGGAVSSTRQAGAVGAGGATSQGGSRQPSSSGGVYQPVLLGPSRASADTERVMAALSGGDKHATPSDSGGTSSSSVSKPSSLSFGVPAAAPRAPGAAPAPTPTLGPRTQARTGARVLTDTPVSAAAAADSVSSSSVQASMHSVGYGSTGGEQAVSSEADDAVGPVSRGLLGPQLVSRGLAASGRVSTELTRSSSATSEELEQLLHQLSQYEEHLLEEAQGIGGLPPELGLQQQQPQQHAEQPSGRGEVDVSLDSSLSWSQTLAGLRHLLPPDSNA